MPELHPRARHAQTSIFTHMSLLAARHGAVNLGQGFPSNPPPAFLLDAARRAVGTVDQYTPPLGLPALREALGADLNVDPADVIVTSGATEGLLTLALSLLVPTRDGQPAELVVFEPVYDVYVPQAELAGARAVPVPLHLDPEEGWSLDLAAVRAAITPRTQALLVNTPHNPTGLVFSWAELTELVALAREHDLWLISDEVYDELYASERPTSLRELAPERTFTVGSAGKRLEVTGWRVGWILCPPGLGGGLSLAGGWPMCGRSRRSARPRRCKPLWPRHCRSPVPRGTTRRCGLTTPRGGRCSPVACGAWGAGPRAAGHLLPDGTASDLDRRGPRRKRRRRGDSGGGVLRDLTAARWPPALRLLQVAG
ncbi:aminotransferase class I/II-fold pyridoxal phosphate-dependent enzyme [Deinococcus radiodurans]|nr:aminotransferase class I/II-fold pyridoxal phosphate-dependent enzyme [Deinococcus radiodurans]